MKNVLAFINLILLIIANIYVFKVYHDTENNPFQKKDEPEKDKNENELIQGKEQFIPGGYSKESEVSNIVPQGIINIQNPFLNTQTIGIYDKNSFIGNAQIVPSPYQNQIIQRNTQNENKFLNQIQNTKNIFDEDYLRGRPSYNYYEIGKYRFKIPLPIKKSPPPKKLSKNYLHLPLY